MIRICNLSGQITLEDNDFWFAFFDTITDKFLELDQEQVWSSWQDFEKDYKNHYQDIGFPESRPLSRFKSLFSSLTSNSNSSSDKSESFNKDYVQFSLRENFD